MAKNFLEIPDNILEKHLLVRTKQIGKNFYHASKNLEKLIDEVVEFYARQFTHGDLIKARKIVETNDK